MNMLEIIIKKRDKQTLTKKEIEYFIQEYTKGNIPDYQAAAFIMAVYLNGMTKQEITDFTIAMAYSGEILELTNLENVVDKHSTGGIGDKITLILMPIIAALGIPVAKMSGRGLGVTGGTIDKLESIPGYQVDLPEEKFKKQVEQIGISLIGQTLNLAPADKKIYALRDVIGCTDSMPLIASSIMSKKIAAGANKLVLEVTCGNGAFMKTKEEARQLANCMKDIGKLAGKEVVCVITNMEEPLGYSVGNTIEVIEATQALRDNKMTTDIKAVIETLGAYMLKLAGKGEDITENKKKIENCIQSGQAFQKYKQWIQAQGGDSTYLENTNQFKKAKYIEKIYAKQEGYVADILAGEIGKMANYLGAGRIKKEDRIDYLAGIELTKKVGDFVKQGETIAILYTNQEEKIKQAKENVDKAIKIVEEKVNALPTILEIIE
ncbi:MAG: thymidine phosphorylase [Clostridia bacterium]